MLIKYVSLVKGTFILIAISGNGLLSLIDLESTKLTIDKVVSMNN